MVTEYRRRSRGPCFDRPLPVTTSKMASQLGHLHRLGQLELGASHDTSPSQGSEGDVLLRVMLVLKLGEIQLRQTIREDAMSR